MNTVSIIKFVSLVIAIWFTAVNIVKAAQGSAIPSLNFLIMSVSIASFVFIQFNLW